MLKSMELPDCIYSSQPVTILPCAPTPKHSLYLSNLDDQKFLRFSIKYMYLFKKSVSLDILKSSLSRVLVDYYPLAGRLRRTSSQDDHKLEVDCNGEGAVFAEAFMDTTTQELLEPSKTPNKSWRKFLYKVEAQSFLDVPPLVVQVTSLCCGGMILCTAISHCLCDGIGTSQFLHAWAQLTAKPQAHLTIMPFHCRHPLKPRKPPQVKFRHPGYTAASPSPQVNLFNLIQSHPLVPTSLTLTPSHLLCLKKQCIPPLKCTSFEAVAAHTWRSWIRSLNPSPPSTLLVKLLFSVNVRTIVNLPHGYYGNGFLLACAESTVEDLVKGKLEHGVKLVQEGKARLKDEEYVRSVVDLLEDKTVKTDLSTTLVISQWSKLGLEEVDFGEGKALHMGPLTTDIYCLFLPVMDDVDAVRVVLSVPENMVDSFHYHMKQGWQTKQQNGDDDNNGYHENGFL
ncbi:fatty alcohol:caffeoyl-CoA acyltransferase-like [Abrus precatorius]|uniref:Fatty alcohol:caffeoyl-CoA acyltransferase-like n=1 Tax=Abrus precatorius TaxID=3816 RepID=A0A8B8LM00_ABRPR|nr:fatty alcohol:caffeoyl-CoA acyltransferase-like [Abrus precatorius]